MSVVHGSLFSTSEYPDFDITKINKTSHFQFPLPQQPDFPEKQSISDELYNKKYYLGDYLGSGGFGKVYKVKNIRLNDYQCAKIMFLKSFPYDSHKNDLSKVLNEAHNMNALSNIKSVVGFYDHFIFREYAILIIEYIKGITLDKYIKINNNNTGLSINIIIIIVKQIIQTIIQIHSHEIIHCDLKPQNIFILDDGITVKIGDFGLSKILLNNTSYLFSSSYSSIGGAIRYFSREIINKNSGNSYQSDIWSIGVILIDMIFGFSVIYNSTIISDYNFYSLKIESQKKNKEKEFNCFKSLIFNSLNINVSERKLGEELMKDEILSSYHEILGQYESNIIESQSHHPINQNILLDSSFPGISDISNNKHNNRNTKPKPKPLNVNLPNCSWAKNRSFKNTIPPSLMYPRFHNYFSRYQDKPHATLYSTINKIQSSFTNRNICPTKASITPGDMEDNSDKLEINHRSNEPQLDLIRPVDNTCYINENNNNTMKNVCFKKKMNSPKIRHYPLSENNEVECNNTKFNNQEYNSIVKTDNSFLNTNLNIAPICQYQDYNNNENTNNANYNPKPILPQVFQNQDYNYTQNINDSIYLSRNVFFPISRNQGSTSPYVVIYKEGQKSIVYFRL